MLPCCFAWRWAIRLILPAFVLFLWLAMPAHAEQIFRHVRLDRAVTVEADTLRFPEDAAARLVTLPDDWVDSRPGFAGTVWYRLVLDAPLLGNMPASAPAAGQSADELLALYIEHVCSNVEVYVNGTLVMTGGRMREPVTRNCHLPQLVTIPIALLRAQGNTLDLKVVGYPLERVSARDRSGRLSALHIGPYRLLEPHYSRQILLDETLPQITGGTLLLLGCLMLVMGWATQRAEHVLYFGAMSAGWAIVSARLWLRDLPLSNDAVEMLVTSCMPPVALAAVRFLIRYAGAQHRGVDAAMLAQCLLVPVSLWLVGPEHLFTVASAWYVALALEVIAAAVFCLRTTWRTQRHLFWPIAMLVLPCALLAAVEAAGQQIHIDRSAAHLARMAIPAFFAAFGLWLMQQYGLALEAAEASRESLEARVREATAEIEKNFSQLAELRVEQVTERERKRIAADLHDDLGAKLLTIVHTSESERISTLAREALEEMRLSVRGLSGKPVKLLDALGDWRAEVVARLSQAGIEADWAAPSEDMEHTLPARAYVQITRILREAVSNIIKHSGASHCGVHCTVADGDAQFIIQDNGNGIPLELDGKLDRGHGMASMKHRAKQLQGQCLVESSPGYGTVIRLTLPL